MSCSSDGARALAGGDLLHAATRACRCSAEQALAHLTQLAGLRRWVLGLADCSEVSPGLFAGRSAFDGTAGYVRVVAGRGAQGGHDIVYRVGANPDALVPRIRAQVRPGAELGWPADTVIVTLLAWRSAEMSDARWARLKHSHETEIELISAQLESAADAAGAATPAAPAARRFIESGSPWEALAGYSRAVVDGDWIFVSGTVGQDFATLEIPEGAQAQAERALDTIERALRDAGAGPLDVVRVRVFVTDRADVGAVSEAVKRRFGAARAANTTLCCALAVEGAKVEIEVTARRNPLSAP